jgi:TRAP-type C4-dicarboxylate transport system permease small subunit
LEPRQRFWVAFERLVDAFLGLAALLVLFDALAVSADVLVRYGADKSWAGLFEITEYSLVWMTFLGLAWVMRQDGHVSMELLVRRLNPRPQAGLRTFSLVVGAAVLAVASWLSLLVVVQDFRAATPMVSILRPLRWPIEAVIPAGLVLLLVETLRKLYGHLRAQGNNPPEGEAATGGR